MRKIQISKTLKKMTIFDNALPAGSSKAKKNLHFIMFSTIYIISTTEII